jgi:hypothetical protein
MKFLFNLVVKIYRKRYVTYKKLRDKSLSKAMKCLLDNNMYKYEMYMERSKVYMNKIKNTTKDAEKFVCEYGGLV